MKLFSFLTLTLTLTLTLRQWLTLPYIALVFSVVTLIGALSYNTGSHAIDTELPALRTRFWIATSLHIDPNNYVYYGNQNGQGFGLWRFNMRDAELRYKLRADDLLKFADQDMYERKRISRLPSLNG
jgi:hypothetical protein